MKNNFLTEFIEKTGKKLISQTEILNLIFLDIEYDLSNDFLYIIYFFDM